MTKPPMTNDKLERVARAWRDSIAENAMVGSSIADLLNDTETLRLAAIAACEAEAGERERVLREALKPFADCVDQIDADEDDEEWAKFRLLIKDYRRARAALNTTAGVRVERKLRDALLSGTVSLTSVHGHSVRIDFGTRGEAEALFEALNREGEAG